MIIGPETRKRLGEAVLVEGLGELRLRSVQKPVRVYRVPVPAVGET